MTTPNVFHQTTPMTTGELLEAIESAETQNDRVMMIFKNKVRPMSPSEVHSIYQTWFTRCPTTSIRRSITNLTIHGYLHHTGTYRPGPYKRAEGVWKLAL